MFSIYRDFTINKSKSSAEAKPLNEIIKMKESYENLYEYISLIILKKRVNKTVLDYLKIKKTEHR